MNLKNNLFDFIFGLIIGATAVVIPFISLSKHNHSEINYYNSKVDSLNHCVDSLQNCISHIQSKIDTVYEQKTLVKYIYEKKADTIWNQSTADDWSYYTKFLSSRFPADSNSTKTN